MEMRDNEMVGQETVEGEKIKEEQVKEKMEDEEIQIIQKNVEKDLFEEQSKILDRFYSLITLTLTAAGVSLTVLTFMSSRGLVNIQEALRSYHVNFCFLCIVLAFMISILNMLALFHHRKLVKIGDMIGYRENNELINNNFKLYLSIARQKNYYVIAITFVGLALISLYNHFAQHPIVTITVGIGFVVIVAFLIRNSRRYLS
jgi:FtsH-binding integral membrane protein